jgi:hypothetical protein
MTWCPKCNWSTIEGPQYVKNEWSERLRYQCQRCGYVQYDLCADGVSEQVAQDLNKSYDPAWAPPAGGGQWATSSVVTTTPLKP